MLELTTPKVRNDTRLAAEFRPKKIEPWLERLPRADRETCVQQLHKALAAQNRVVLPPSLRLQLMEMYLAPFLDIYASHHSDLTAIARVPLHPHYRSKQEDMLELMEAMAAGYKLVVMDLVGQNRGQAQRLDLALAMQRAMYYLGQVLVTVFELYARPPGGAWRDLHQLYHCAEEQDMRELEVRPLSEHDGPRDVLSTYLPVLLVGASAPQGLLPGEARRLYDLSPQWHSSMKLTDGSTVSSGPGYFRVNLQSDSPPVPLSKASKPIDADVRILRTLRVARAMHDSLKRMNDPSTQKALRSVMVPGMDAVDVELFRRAGRVLGEVNITRASTRFDANQDLEFCSGFESVHLVCSDGAFEEASRNGSTQAADGTDTEQEGEQFIDLSEPMLGVPVAFSPDTRNGYRAGAAFRVIAVNQSAGGMCLVLQPDRDIRIKVGDVGAYRLSHDGEWQLGAVRWMRAGSREIRFGIQFLGPQATALTAHPGGAASGGDGEGTGPDAVLKAVWLPENPALKQPHSIILPRSTEPYPGELEILDAAGANPAPRRIRLLGRLERTGDYEHYLASLDSSLPDS